MGWEIMAYGNGCVLGTSGNSIIWYYADPLTSLELLNYDLTHAYDISLGDMHKGTQITESMLLKGANITAVGEVILSPEGVKIIPPTGSHTWNMLYILL